MRHACRSVIGRAVLEAVQAGNCTKVCADGLPLPSCPAGMPQASRPAWQAAAFPPAESGNSYFSAIPWQAAGRAPSAAPGAQVHPSAMQVPTLPSLGRDHVKSHGR